LLLFVPLLYLDSLLSVSVWNIVQNVLAEKIEDVLAEEDENVLVGKVRV